MIQKILLLVWSLLFTSVWLSVAQNPSAQPEGGDSYIPDFEKGVYMMPDGTPTDDKAQGVVFGKIGSILNVSANGSLMYQIPIEVPSGVNGMNPSIQLVYNSQAGNGIAGYGFNLSCVSSIYRARKNLFSDGKPDAIHLTDEDNIELDGARLILTSGNNLADGSKYRTQEETYCDITFHSGDDKDGSYFSVVTKEGVTMVYGASGDARVESQTSGVPLIWLLTKVTDQNGNYMSYEYGLDDENGEFWLSKILYTGNENAKVAPTCAVDFTYDSGRKDSRLQFTAGSKLSSTKLLRTVEVKANGKLLKTYTLSYFFDGFYNKLKSITLSNDNEESLAPIVLNWSSMDKISESAHKIEKSVFVPFAEDDDCYDEYSVLVDDFNNDGISDFIKTNSDLPTGFSAIEGVIVEWNLYLSRKTESGVMYEKAMEVPMDYFIGALLLHSLDINKDGKKDLIEVKRSGSYYWVDVLLNDGEGTFIRQNFETEIVLTDSDQSQLEFNDFDGDGFVEMLVLHKEETETYEDVDFADLYKIDIEGKLFSKISSFSYKSQYLTVDSRYSITDLNGNGLPEIYNRASHKAFEFDSNTKNFEKIDFEEIPLYLDMDAGADFVDINGDGYTDVIAVSQYEYENKWKIMLSTGTGFVEIPCPLKMECEKTSPYVVDCIAKGKRFYADYNNDGTLDILEIINDELTFHYFTGSGFVSKKYSQYELPDILTNKLYYNKHIPFYDISGDGITDLISLSKNGLDVHSVHTPEIGRYLSQINDGLLSIHAVDYKTLSDPVSYQSGQNERSSKVTQPCIPIHVVSQITTESGIYESTEKYYYKGLRFHQEKGMLGFEEFTQDNETLNKRKTIRYGYDTILFNPHPVEETTFTSATGRQIENVVFEHKTENLGTKSGKRCFKYVAKKSVTNCLTGRTTIIEASDYEDGNPQKITTTQGNVVEEKTMTYERKGSWCKNRVSCLTTKMIADGQEQVRKVLSFYDDRGNQTKEIADPDDENEFVTEYKNINHFGQALLVERSANGTTRRSEFEYCPSGRFMTAKTDEMGDRYEYDWDENTGLLKSKTDRKGTVSFSYDGFGNLTETNFADGITETSVTRWATQENSLGAKYYTYHVKSGSVPVVTWYDNVGNEVLKETFGLNNKKISVFTQYNSDGTKSRVSAPTFSSDPQSWATVYSYDEYGRVTSLITPAGKSTTKYEKSSTTTVSPEGRKKMSYDASGRIVSIETNGKSVNYEYYPSGKIKTSTPEGGASISVEYDLQGRRTRLTDPDGGVQETKYNGFGELLWSGQSVHKKGDTIATEYSYAENGLLLSKTTNGKTTSYDYDSHNRIVAIEIQGEHRQSFTYDEFDRVVRQKEEIDGKIFESRKEYDEFGRVRKETYPSGFFTVNHYDRNGILYEVTDSLDRSVWKLLEEDAYGQSLRTQKGAKESVFGYDEQGHTLSIYAEGVVDMLYAYDSRGNLESRTDNMTSQQEMFGYDDMNRLTNWDIYRDGALVKENSLTFDGQGNIMTKSDLGDCVLNYGDNGKPHALTSIEGAVTGIPVTKLTLAYTDFQKVEKIEEGNKSYSIFYGVDEQRRKSVYKENGKTKRVRYYCGNYEEETDSIGNVRKIHYLAGGSLFIQNCGNDSLLYAYHDFQGSLIALTDEDGNVLERYAYDPWGARRNSEKWEEKDQRKNHLIDRGYTGHEHIDAFAIINMNGRIYDPLTATFFSVDPYVQSPDDWLNYNRYAYCMFNPFLYVDPSGEFWHIIVGAVVGGIINWVSHDSKFSLKGLGYFAVGAAVGAASAVAGAWVASVAQSAGIITGVAIGASTGAATGAITSVSLNGLNNVIDGQSFWTGWQQSLASGAIIGSISGGISGGLKGYELSKNGGKNIWWGNDIKYGRSEWSFFTSEKPYETISWEINNVGTQSVNDCVPTSFAEASDYFNGNKSYEEYKTITGYIEGEGVTMGRSNYDDLVSDNFKSTKFTREAFGKSSIVRNIKNENGLFHVNMPYRYGTGRHADILRSVKYYKSGKIMLNFRSGSYKLSSIDNKWWFYILKGVK